MSSKLHSCSVLVFFFNDTATTEIYTLSLHDALPIQRVVTRPGPLAIVLYRLSHALWERGFETLAEVIWRVNYFITGADIHPGAEIGGASCRERVSISVGA